MKYILSFLAIASISYNLFSQSVTATVNSGSHLIKTIDWSRFINANILVEKLDGTKRKTYMLSATRPSNPNAMYIEGLQDDFEQGSQVKVYVLKPKVCGITSNPMQASVNGGSHLIKTTDWSVYSRRTILVEEINGMNQNVYSYIAVRPTNPGAMYVDGIVNDYEQGTDVYVYIIDDIQIYNNSIGVGTPTPNGKFEVHMDALSGDAMTLQKNSGPGIKFKGTSNVDLGMLEVVDYNQEIRFYNGPGGNLTQKMVINSSGNVGIGKTDPGNYKLNVDGRLRANEIVVNTTGADFVFEPNYKLRPLTEVETFIKQNKHLPEISSAKEMQNNGVSMGDMQTKLLQKLEELTLYSIEQNKKLMDQQNQINQLLQVIETMKKNKDLFPKSKQ